MFCFEGLSKKNLVILTVLGAEYVALISYNEMIYLLRLAGMILYGTL